MQEVSRIQIIPLSAEVSLIQSTCTRTWPRRSFWPGLSQPSVLSPVLGGPSSLQFMPPFLSAGQGSELWNHHLTSWFQLLGQDCTWRQLLTCRGSKGRSIPLAASNARWCPCPASCFVTLALERHAGEEIRKDQVAGKKDDVNSGIWD